jgi:hypothetical protein
MRECQETNGRHEVQTNGGTWHGSGICAAERPEKAAKSDPRQDHLLCLGIDPDTMEVKTRACEPEGQQGGGSLAN